jgi:hypothetical protein
MRIALSPPVRWVSGLAAVATIAILVTRPPAPPLRVSPAPHSTSDARQARAAMSNVERDLDALVDRVQEAVDAVVNAESDAERKVAHDRLVSLQAEVAAERQLLVERERQLRITLAH